MPSKPAFSTLFPGILCHSMKARPTGPAAPLPPPPGPPPRGGTHVMEICQEERAACGGVEPKVESNALRKGSSTVGNRRGSITMPSHSFSRHADIVWFLNGSVCGNAARLRLKYWGEDPQAGWVLWASMWGGGHFPPPEGAVGG